ncbi:prolyl oligopeptidase family serine peptidase [Pseudohalioglobus sediminis]|uniref:Prolyl oligopeptidase family serine peptidase n=1 Tax=Pseudohalioglobus sediminis TaxID=2606449 RepID=A0A5B0WTH2_9GAMM|nr:prolyl oligopeptidase family serine peptidase [Pseudohalioglobus sediminis]
MVGGDQPRCAASPFLPARCGCARLPHGFAAGLWFRNDQRAPIEHARALEAALEQSGVDVHSQYYERGGHGYCLESANNELYRELLSFLEQHLKE